MSKAITLHGQPYMGVASSALRGFYFDQGLSSLTTGKSKLLDIFATQAEMRRVFGSPSREPRLLASERVQIAAVPREEAQAPARTVAPVSTAIVVAKDSKPAQTVAAEPKKSLWQTLTQRKVLIAAGVVLGVATLGGAAAAAYYFYPVATAAHAVTVGQVGRAAAMNTHQLFIRPGFANTLFFANLAMKAAVIPAAKVTLPLLLPVISTAIVTTVGTLILLYVANKAWQAAKAAMWGTGSFVANKFDEQLTQTGLGRGAKWLVGPLVSTAVSPIVSALAPEETTSGEPESDEEDSIEDVTDVALQPRLQIEGPAKKAKAEVTDEAEAVRVEKSHQGKKAKARKAQARTESTWTETIIRTSLLAAGLSAGIYFYTKAKPDLNVGQ